MVNRAHHRPRYSSHLFFTSVFIRAKGRERGEGQTDKSTERERGGGRGRERGRLKEKAERGTEVKQAWKGQSPRILTGKTGW